MPREEMWRCTYQSGAWLEIVDTLNWVILEEFTILMKVWTGLGAPVKVI